ncbi:MAG: DUF3570 domain-containing protein [Nitrospiria bacterium]
MSINRPFLTLLYTCLVLDYSTKIAMAIDPPEDRSFVGYNLFEGGGMTVHGPAVIIRKEIKGHTAINAGARVDMVSSASIDVVTQASQFTETRQEYNLGGTRIFGETLISTHYTHSDESDYTSDTLAFDLAHDLFDKNFTIDLNMSRSWDKVGKNGDPSFGLQDYNRSTYRVGLAQSINPSWLTQLSYELTADEGHLSNPYRNALTEAMAWVPEHYPEARTGQAWVVRTSFRSPFGTPERDEAIGSTIQLHYRYYQDTFDIHSHTAKFIYQKYVSSNWLIGGSYRYYRQNAASFYGDRLPVDQTFKARDKELSRFSDHWFGADIQFEPDRKRWGGIQNPFFRTHYRFILFRYDNFTDLQSGDNHAWEANVIQISFGFKY